MIVLCSVLQTAYQHFITCEEQASGIICDSACTTIDISASKPGFTQVADHSTKIQSAVALFSISRKWRPLSIIITLQRCISFSTDSRGKPMEISRMGACPVDHPLLLLPLCPCTGQPSPSEHEPTGWTLGLNTQGSSNSRWMSLLHQAPARTFLKRVSLPILCFEEAGPRHFVLKQTFDVQTYHYQVRTYRDLKEWLSFWTVMEAFKNLQHFPSQPNKQSAVSSNCVQLSPSLSSMFLSAEFARRSLEGSWVAVTSPRACCTTGF